MDKELQPIVEKLEKEFGIPASEYRGDVRLVDSTVGVGSCFEAVFARLPGETT